MSKYLALICVIVAASCGALDAWAGRGSYFAGDTVSYVDMASHISRGHIAEAVNGVWSPLYPIILAAAIRYVEPGSIAEFTVVRCVNFGLFLLTMMAYRLLVSRIADCLFSRTAPESANRSLLTREQFLLAAWAPFLWACFSLNIVARVSADTCVTLLAFLAFGQLLVLVRGAVRPGNFVLLGILLGAGFWAKAILFPIGFLFLGSACLIPAIRPVRSRLLLTLAAFVCVASPLVIALSAKYHHLTFGEAGRLNYAWHVNGVQHWTHWEGGNLTEGTPYHPEEIIFSRPAAYAFRSAIDATYAPWYDPAYWYEGVRTHFSIAQQARALWVDSREFLKILAKSALFWMLVVAGGLAGYTWRSVLCLATGLRPFLVLWIVAGGAIGLYLLVHVEPRYLAPFLSVLALLAIAALARTQAPFAKAPGNLVVALCLLGGALTAEKEIAVAAERFGESGGSGRDSVWNVAEALAKLPIPRGTLSAAIGDTWPHDWARLARLRIIGEVVNRDGEHTTSQDEVFWKSPPLVRAEVLQAFRAVGARLVVARDVPAGADTSGWAHIPDSDFYYRLLDGGV
jgi:hypothetical protein